MKSQISKLRHLLINDPRRSHDYIFKFLKEYFSIYEIGDFTEMDLKNFISKVITQTSSLTNATNTSMRDFINDAMNRDSGVRV